ncbi:transmembrane protein 150A [Eucyclogobius newberryi]|uniref:transmembrane protein 150A n=1 Tax=Eucyclogobius newberryi TaxID=166745 RepID=UPI003B5984BB
MWLWTLLPITLASVSFVGTWTVYGLAHSNSHVCSLSDWTGESLCFGNNTVNCCHVPTISSSGTYAPENSLFTATINAGSFLFLIFCVFHHAHVMEKHAGLSMMSRITVLLGIVAGLGAFVAGNCNPYYLALLHYLGAALSFVCICFYTVLLTALTGRYQLSGFERFLYPYRVAAAIIQAIVTICYTIFFAQEEKLYQHVSAVFEWMLSVNLQLFELSYAVEFYYFSSYMISNVLSKRDEQKPLMMTLS